MSISLQRFNSGDTNYIAKHNSNADVLEAAVKGLESQVAGAFGGALSIGEALQAIFGSTAALIGAASYQPTLSGSSLAVAPGFAWLASQSIVVRSVSTKSVSFSGAAAATYYLTADATGNPIRSTNITDALYAVVRTGAGFGTITRFAPVVWGGRPIRWRRNPRRPWARATTRWTIGWRRAKRRPSPGNWPAQRRRPSSPSRWPAARM